MRVAILFFVLINIAGSAAAEEALPVPDKAELVIAEKTVKDVYGQDIEQARSPAERRALMKRFIEEAGQNADEPANQYAILQAALSIAPDAVSAFEVVDTITTTFDVNAFQLKVSTVGKLSKTAKTTMEYTAVANAAYMLIEHAQLNDDYVSASELGKSALQMAKRARDAELVQKVKEKVAEARKQKGEYDKAKRSLTVLEKDPTNTEANTIAGKYLCLVKGDWEHGLAMLALGQDKVLKTLSILDLKKPASSDKQVELGDRWYDLSKNFEGLTQDSLVRRAAYWYESSLNSKPPLSGLTRLKVVKRLKENVAIEIPFPLGQWVDVLGRVDVSEHALSGSWTKQGQEFFIDPKKTACRLIVPVTPDGDYDFEIQFSRIRGIWNEWNTTTVILPIGLNSCCIWFNTGGPSGIDRINDKRPNERGNPTTLRITMENGKQQSAVISVRYHGKKVATIQVTLNGRKIFMWRGPPSALSLNPDWKHQWPNTLGLGAFCSQTVFHKVRLKMLSGKAIQNNEAK